MPGFVIEYNRVSQERRVTPFLGDQGHRQALLKRIELEAQRTDEDWEIASLNSDSLQTIMSTHSRYFQGIDLKTA